MPCPLAGCKRSSSDIRFPNGYCTTVKKTLQTFAEGSYRCDHFSDICDTIPTIVHIPAIVSDRTNEENAATDGKKLQLLPM